MYKLTKIERKNQDRIDAWAAGQPFQENSRDKHPQVPDLAVEQVLADYRVRYEPQGYGSFYTPLPIGKQLIDNFTALQVVLRNPTIGGYRLLEPAAGIGHLLYHLRDWGQYNVSIDAVELSSDAFALGRQLFPAVDWYHGCIRDFMVNHPHENAFDFVVANPPFGAQVGLEAGQEWTEGRQTKSEYIFLEAITRALKVGAQAAVIWPENGREPWAGATKKGQAWFDAHVQLERVASLHGNFAGTAIAVRGLYLRRLL